MTVEESRRRLRHLLDERSPADALASYYAFHHAAGKTNFFTYPQLAQRAAGYVAVSRTGIDLFRPLVTMRLPRNEMAASVDLLHQALEPGLPVLLNAISGDLPLLQALFEMQTATRLRLFVLDRSRYEPVINVLVSRVESANSWPRFAIHSAAAGEREVVASAGLNWLTPYFGDIAVHTNAGYRRQGWGRSVVAAVVQYLLDMGRTPLYEVEEGNEASIQLAHSVGFVDSGQEQILAQATLRQRP